MDTSTIQEVTDKFVTPFNIDGYIVPTILRTKVLPNLKDGLEFIGFLKEIDSSHCMPYKHVIKLTLFFVKNFYYYLIKYIRLIILKDTQLII